jgi:DNA-binding transcriptional MerR regulator
VPPTDETYSLHDLADVADVTPRTIRYYIAQGLLPAASQVGPGARYTDRHLDRIRLIKLLQREHLPLAEIRSRLAKLDDRQVAELAQSKADSRLPSQSAVDYVRSVLDEPPRSYMSLPAASITPAAAAPSAAPAAARWRLARPAREIEAPPSTPPDRSQWDRITLTPDIELHVRRPLTRHHNRLVDRLIATARQLFEEESS